MILAAGAVFLVPGGQATETAGLDRLAPVVDAVKTEALSRLAGSN